MEAEEGTEGVLPNVKEEIAQYRLDLKKITEIALEIKGLQQSHTDQMPTNHRAGMLLIGQSGTEQ